MEKVILATRKSPLAVCQAELVKTSIETIYPGVKCELSKLETTADKHLDWSLKQMGGKGLFTKELEEKLLEEEADFAVHSAKDLPSELPNGLVIGGYLKREVVHDVLILKKGIKIPKTLATGSPRRLAQLQRLFPGCEFRELRGNIETRLEKIAKGELANGTVLAAAGLKRLNIHAWEGLEFRHLKLEEMVPAVGQGAIAIECLEGKECIIEKIFDEETRRSLMVERFFLEMLGGGCHVAYGVHYHQKKLYLFHESVGFVELEFNFEEQNVRDWVSSVIEKLNL